MALQLFDRVQAASTANTTVSFTLGSATNGYQGFSVLTNGNTTYYVGTDASNNWEVGLGTYNSTGPLLTRTTILASSNSGSAVTFSGSVTVSITYPAEVAVYQNMPSIQFGSLGVGTAASGTAGEIRATNNITAYYSSDIKFKENIQPITNALDVVKEIGADHFDWTDEYIKEHGGPDDYFLQKSDFGVIAQKVQKVFPKAVRSRKDGSLAVDYEKLGILAFPAILELLARVETLENKGG